LVSDDPGEYEFGKVRGTIRKYDSGFRLKKQAVKSGNKLAETCKFSGRKRGNIREMVAHSTITSEIATSPLCGSSQ